MALHALASHRLKLYSIAELLALPGPTWLLEKICTTGALVGVYGPSGHGKSFLALDWALSIAAGKKWQGRSVQQGMVVYVAAEGGQSISKRVKAWTEARGLDDIPAAFFLLEGIQVRDRGDLEPLVRRIRERGGNPVLIVIDTLARCFVGGDENSAKEMGEFVAGLGWLCEQTGATVMVLHHTGKQAHEMERGSSALRAAADAMILVSKDDSAITVTNNKQKDAEEFEEMSLHLQQVVFDDGETSCVLQGVDSPTTKLQDLAGGLRRTLLMLANTPKALTTEDWQERTGLPQRTLHNHRKELVKLKYVSEIARGVYKATPIGRKVGAAARAKRLHRVK